MGAVSECPSGPGSLNSVLLSFPQAPLGAQSERSPSGFLKVPFSPASERSGRLGVGPSLLISLPQLINSPLICTPFLSRAGRAELMGLGRGEGRPAPCDVLSWGADGTMPRAGPDSLPSWGQDPRPHLAVPSWSC